MANRCVHRSTVLREAEERLKELVCNGSSRRQDDVDELPLPLLCAAFPVESVETGAMRE